MRAWSNVSCLIVWMSSVRNVYKFCVKFHLCPLSYPTPVKIAKSSAACMYALFFFLEALCLCWQTKASFPPLVRNDVSIVNIGICVLILLEFIFFPPEPYVITLASLIYYVCLCITRNCVLRLLSCISVRWRKGCFLACLGMFQGLRHILYSRRERMLGFIFIFVL
jgi:hypothetical protein